MKQGFIYFITSILFISPCLGADIIYNGQCGDSITWSLNIEDSILHLVGSGNMWKYERNKIPWDTLRSFIVHTQIDEKITFLSLYTFIQCKNLEEISFPNNVTSIMPRLKGCNKLKSLHLSENFTELPDSALHGCTSLDSIYIYDKVTKIGARAFENINIDYLSLGISVQQIGGYCCYNGTINKIDYRGGISDWCNIAFNATLFSKNTGLYINHELADSIYIPDEVTSIKKYTFSSYSRMRYVSYKEGTNVTLDAFQGVYIPLVARREGQEDVVDYHQGVANNVPWLYRRSDQSLAFSNGGAIPDYSISNNPAPWFKYPIDSIYLHWDISRLGTCAFANIPTLRTFGYTSMDAITSFGDSVFYGCPNLHKSITIPLATDTIGRDVFSGCSNLIKIQYYKYLKFNENSFPADGIPIIQLDTFSRTWSHFGEDIHFRLAIEDSILTIFGKGKMTSGYYTIPWASAPQKIKYVIVIDSVLSLVEKLCCKCTNLQDIQINSPLISIGKSAFEGCSLLDSVVFPQSLQTLDDCAFMNASKLSKVVFNEGLTTINRSVFEECTSLNTITFPKSLRTLGNRAFLRAKNLTKVMFNEGLTTIGNQAFLQCGKLSMPQFPQSLTAIGDNAFELCTSMSSKLIIPNKVTKIGTHSFYKCYSIKEVVLPLSIVSIGTGAFYLSDSISIVRYKGTIEDWIKINFASVSANPSYYAHQIYFEENRAPKEINFSDTVQSIGAYAFINDTQLRQVSYYKHTEIGTDAFRGTNANIIIKDLDTHTTNAMIHGKLTTHSKEQLIRVNFVLIQNKTHHIVTISTSEGGVFNIDWENNTYTTVSSVAARRVQMDELGSVVIINIDPQKNTTTKEVVYSIDVDVTNLPSVGKYPYILKATTQYTEDVTEEVVKESGEVQNIYHYNGEQNEYMLSEGVINTDDDGGGIVYWGGDNFFIPSENTDVYDFQGHYVGKWSSNIPHGLYIIREGDKTCKLGK